MKNILLIHGPNLNMLGKREPKVYGTQTEEELVSEVSAYAEQQNCHIDFFQSNHEGEIIDAIHATYKKDYIGIIINPGAYTHYSYAIRDAIACVPHRFMEVHLSDITKREAFRKNDVITEVCEGMICGKGIKGYFEAIDKLLHIKS